MTTEKKSTIIKNLIKSLGNKGVDLEFKEAKDTLPKSIWEQYLLLQIQMVA